MSQTALRLARLAGRVVLAAVGCGLLVVVMVQFTGIVAKNTSLSAQLAASRSQIEQLRTREAQQRRTIARLSVPEGAIPEIHEQLRLVGPNEELIYLRGLPTAPPRAHWQTTP